MSHEQREFSPNTAQIAYNLESQAIVVDQEQISGILNQENVWVWPSEIQKVKEAELEWYFIGITQLKLFSGDCDEEVIEELLMSKKNGNRLIVITGVDSRPDVCFGRNERLVAAVLTDGKKIVYKSPDFDLETYMQDHDSSATKDNRDEK